jgi:ubiquinone/menaquinone biosynthesis C-methylase UbiE
VLDRGHGGESEDERSDLSYLVPIRDRVLSNATIRVDDTVLDVGAGDGLIAFGAAELVGPNGTVIFSDISHPLLNHARSLADERGVAAHMEFVKASAEDLGPVPAASIDVVTTRSVLIYVEDKAAAFREFYRVLRSGGRVSIFEPIDRYFELTPDEFWGFDATPVRDLVQRLWAFEGWDDPVVYESDPMSNFDERDLFQHAEAAGFEHVIVELVIERKPGSWVRDWETLLKTAPNPNAHTMGQLMDEALSSEEANRFESYMRPLVDSREGVMKSAFAYLRAVKN